MRGAMYPANKTPLNRYIQHLCASFHLLILSNNIKKKKIFQALLSRAPWGNKINISRAGVPWVGHPHSTRTSTSIPAWGSLQGCCSSPLTLSSGQQWALGSFCPGAGGRCVQLRAGRARLDPVHWEMLPVLRDFLVLPQEELVLWDTEGHQGTDMGGVLRPGHCSPSPLLPFCPVEVKAVFLQLCPSGSCGSLLLAITPAYHLSRQQLNISLSFCKTTMAVPRATEAAVPPPEPQGAEAVTVGRLLRTAG